MLAFEKGLTFLFYGYRISILFLRINMFSVMWSETVGGIYVNKHYIIQVCLKRKKHWRQPTFEQ